MITSQSFLNTTLALALFFVLISEVTVAQESTAAKSPQKKWAYIVEPYMMFPNMKGAVGLGDLP